MFSIYKFIYTDESTIYILYVHEYIYKTVKREWKRCKPISIKDIVGIILHIHTDTDSKQTKK